MLWSVKSKNFYLYFEYTSTLTNVIKTCNVKLCYHLTAILS